MIILGNILNSSEILVATGKGISLVNSKALYAKMVLQIEKIGKDTFDRVVYRFPLWGVSNR